MTYFKTGQEWLDQSTLLIQANPTTTRITTRYSIKAVKRRKPSATADATASSSADAKEKPPRAELVLKTFDPRSGVTLKYRTTKAAEVSRLMGAAMGRLGRSMAALPQEEEEGGGGKRGGRARSRCRTPRAELRMTGRRSRSRRRARRQPRRRRPVVVVVVVVARRRRRARNKSRQKGED